MHYVIDIHAAPPCVVLVSEDESLIKEVAQRYCDQVLRDLVVATGPRASEPTFRPTVAQATVEVAATVLPPRPPDIPLTSRKPREQ